MIEWKLPRRHPRTGMESRYADFVSQLQYTFTNHDLSRKQQEERIAEINQGLDGICESPLKFLGLSTKESELINVDITNFSATPLTRIGLLSFDLQVEALRDHSHSDALVYSKRLVSVLNKCEGQGHLQREIDTLRSAVRWLSFWTSKGMGFMSARM